MTGISCHPDIEYAQIPGFRPLELDLYLPDPAARASPDPVPVVVRVPGASHFRDGADDVPGIVAQSASFAASLVPLEV